jgi:hypothetical protein
MSRAVVSTSSLVSRARNNGSSASGRPCDMVVAAARLMRRMRPLVSPVPAFPVRSLPSRNFAQSQPRSISPTSWSAGTRTLSKNTSLTSYPPSISSIGRTVTPGDFMSMSRNEMPCCFFAAGLVRTRQKIQSAYCASVVQVFCPLTTK